MIVNMKIGVIVVVFGIIVIAQPQINAKTQSEVLSCFHKLEKVRRHLDEVQVHSEADGEDEGVTKENDRIERLPGQPPVRFNQYGGYVSVNHTAGRALYYYFVEAQTSHNSSPLLLWLNGGPGCSSLGYGAMEELGPFRVHSDGKTLYHNTFSWNHEANVLFLESPAGVGFSYSNTSSDLMSNGDKRTAIDNYAFLVNWLERFPEYKDRDLYIAGESYAGHYVPQLAQTILHHNHNNTIIHLKGVIIGNAYINLEEDTRGRYEYYGSHALVSDEIIDGVMKYCYSNPKQPQLCSQARLQADSLAALVNDFNTYAPWCTNGNLTQKPNHPSVLHRDPCSDQYVEAYMNRPEVQKALHANLTNIPYPWRLCSDDYSHWKDWTPTVLPILKELMAHGLRVWLYSGDVDGNVPVTSTKNSIKAMKLPIKTSWRAWYHGDEVGGYTQVYEGDLTFATVRGAGHEVPSYQPAQALTLINSFLTGIELPR